MANCKDCVNFDKEDRICMLFGLFITQGVSCSYGERKDTE